MGGHFFSEGDSGAAVFALPGDLLDDQGVGGIADILFAGDRYMLAGERHQSGVLRGGGRFAVDGEEDGAVVAKDDEGGTVFCACPGTGYADGFVETLGIGACRINYPTGDGDVGAAICRYCETGCSDEGRCQKLTEETSHFFILEKQTLSLTVRVLFSLKRTSYAERSDSTSTKRLR